MFLFRGEPSKPVEHNKESCICNSGPKMFNLTYVGEYKCKCGCGDCNERKKKAAITIANMCNQ